MNRKTAKLIRGFTKLTNLSFRAHKRAYNDMSAKDKAETKKQLLRFWKENSQTGLLDNKKYYDLKLPLKASTDEGVGEHKNIKLDTEDQKKIDEIMDR